MYSLILQAWLINLAHLLNLLMFFTKIVNQPINNTIVQETIFSDMAKYD